MEDVLELQAERCDDFEAVGADHAGVELVGVCAVRGGCRWWCLLSRWVYDLDGGIVLLGLEMLC